MGARTPRGPGGGFITPGGPGPGIRPPKGDGGGSGVRPPKSEPTTPPRIDPPRTPDKGVIGGTIGKSGPGLFAGLMEGIKKTDKFNAKFKNKMKEGGKGIGGPVTTPGPKPPVFDNRVYLGGGSPIPGVGGHEYLNDPKYHEHRKEYYAKKNKEKEEYIKKKQEERERERIGEEYVKNKDRDLRDIPPRFPSKPKPRFTPKDDYFSRDRFEAMGGDMDSLARAEAEARSRRNRSSRRRSGAFFGEKEPSRESRRRTKESPKRGMRKAGRPVDSEARNKFEEMLAYMKSFQR